MLPREPSLEFVCPRCGNTISETIEDVPSYDALADRESDAQGSVEQTVACTTCEHQFSVSIRNTGASLGRVYEVDVEVWPTCITLPVGFRIALTIAGKDFERPGGDAIPSFRSRGSGPWIHDDPYYRPWSIFGGETTLHSSPSRQSFLLPPIVPEGLR